MPAQIQTPYHLCFETLSNDLRMNILDSIRSSPKSVTSIASVLGVERSRISHALQMLKLCSMVDMKKEGKENVYFICDERLFSDRENVLKILDDHMKNYCGSCKKIVKSESY